MELKAAYDILMDTNLRDVYSKFGLPGIEHKNDTSELMGSLGFFYVVWLAAAYLLTRRKSVGAAQTWTFTGLLALVGEVAALEVELLVRGLDASRQPSFRTCVDRGVTGCHDECVVGQHR